ncbi:MAG: hypothetical protein SU899_05250 [Chloroflexota bacterium]|nr:hypothetical protein [Chloroflexota bacterium]
MMDRWAIGLTWLVTTIYPMDLSGPSAYFEEQIPDRELAEAQAKYPIIRSKEESYYFKLFTEHFGADRAVETVGQCISF